MTENLLGENVEALPEIDPNKDYLKELVGDGKKFKSPEDLARGKYEADQYIELLKRRTDELRADYLRLREDNTNKNRLEDLLNQLTNKPIDSELTLAREEHQPTLDSKQIESLVSSRIQEHETSRQEMNNFNHIKDRLREKYGSNYKARIQEQIEDLGITEQELNDLARRQPKVLSRTLGLDQTNTQNNLFQAPPSSSKRNDNFAPQAAEKRTWAYYQKMREKDPKVWLDRKTAIQMHNDMQELGEAFQDGDYWSKGLHDKS